MIQGPVVGVDHRRQVFRQHIPHCRQVPLRVVLLPPLDFGGVEEDLLDHGHPLRSQEHVLGAAEANTLRPQRKGPLGIGLRIGVGHYAQPSSLVGPGEETVGLL